MWHGRAQSLATREPSHGADVARGEPSPGADCGRGEPTFVATASRSRRTSAAARCHTLAHAACNALVPRTLPLTKQSTWRSAGGLDVATTATVATGKGAAAMKVCLSVVPALQVGQLRALPQGPTACSCSPSCLAVARGKPRRTRVPHARTLNRNKVVEIVDRSSRVRRTEVARCEYSEYPGATRLTEVQK